VALYGNMPAGWKVLNVSLGGEPSWVKTFDVVVRGTPSKLRRRVIVALNPFSDKWFWQTTGTPRDDGVGDEQQYDDPVVCAVVCEMQFGGQNDYKPKERKPVWDSELGCWA
jgi:hypothetical protein